MHRGTFNHNTSLKTMLQSKNNGVGRLDQVSENYRALSPSLGESSWLSFTFNSSIEPEALHEVENRLLSLS